MINTYFKDKFPFAYNYFSTMLEFVSENKRNFPQAIIFEGADTKNQYLFALELARILNCQNNGEHDCDCINCKWIRSHSHPCVNNVSQIHFKPDGDETKTVISTKQAKAIEQSLKLSSDYYRFFIFFSSENKEYTQDEMEDFHTLRYNDIDFAIKPLEYDTFHIATPNALLKSIEEPPKNTTFIFLTQSRENILPTIVSRCLVFKLSSACFDKDDKKYFNTFSKYLDMDYSTAFDFSDELQNIIKENNISIDDVLNDFLSYQSNLIKENIADKEVYSKLKKDINFVNEALKHSKASMSDKTVLDTLVLRLVRGY